MWSEIEFRGLPKTRDDARFMAGSDPFRFERWAASLVDGMEANKKQRGDHGIDGWGRLPIKKGQFIDMVLRSRAGMPLQVTFRRSTGHDSRLERT